MIGRFFLEALSVLNANRLRSLLTISGLVIGVAAVVAIQIVGRGTAGAVEGILGALDNGSFIVFPNTRQGDFSRAALRLSDIERLTTLPNVRQAVPFANTTRFVYSGDRHARLSITAESDIPFYAAPIAQGRAISAQDIESESKVAVLSQHAYELLFEGRGDAIGRTLRVGDERFTIVGVQGAERNGIIPISFRNDVAVPYSTFAAIYLHNERVFATRVVLIDKTRFEQTEADVLKHLRDLKAGRVEYQTFDRKSFSTAVDGVFAALTAFVGLIGAVALVVAGIGILNIMLVSVAERTREIGLRKAIGATRFQVLLQFLIEALALSAVGCAIGLTIGTLAGWAVDQLAIKQLSGVVAPIPWLEICAIAAGFATIVALVFGTYPAYRAASLDPIEALRYE